MLRSGEVGLSAAQMVAEQTVTKQQCLETWCPDERREPVCVVYETGVFGAR